MTAPFKQEAPETNINSRASTNKIVFNPTPVKVSKITPLNKPKIQTVLIII